MGIMAISYRRRKQATPPDRKNDTIKILVDPKQVTPPDGKNDTLEVLRKCMNTLMLQHPTAEIRWLFQSIFNLFWRLLALPEIIGRPIWVPGHHCGGPWAVLGEPWGGPGAASDALGCPWERRETSLGSLKGASGVLGNPLGCLGVPLRAHRGSEGSRWDASDGFGNPSKTIGFCCISTPGGTLG